jgi:hypothetical protein
MKTLSLITGNPSHGDFHCFEARQKYREMEQFMFSETAMGMSFSDVQDEQFRQAREVNRILLQAHLDARGTGIVGPAIEVTNNEGTSLHNHLRIRERNVSAQ